MRVLLDTNVLIAAAMKPGLAREILSLATQRILTLILSRDILQELADKLETKFHWKKEVITEYCQALEEMGELVSVQKQVNVITRDPDDNKILSAAISGNADLIVTSDQDLIQLKTIQKIAIVHPRTLVWIFPEYFNTS